MPQQIDLNQIQYQAAQVRPVDNSAFVNATSNLIDAGALLQERSAFKSLQKDVSSLEQDYQNEKQADATAFADVRAQLANGTKADSDTAELQAHAVKLANKLRQGGNSLDYVTKLQLATKQAKMRAPWAADKLEATFQQYVGSEGSSMIYTDYQASQKLQQQYQQQLLSDASEMGLHPADPFLEQKVLQGKAEAYKLKTDMQKMQAVGASDELVSRSVINASITGVDNQIESVISAAVAQYGSLDMVPVEQQAMYVQQLAQLKANARLSIENSVTRSGLIKPDKEHLNSMVASLTSKVDLMTDMLNGKVSSDIIKNGYSIAENGVMLDLYNKDVNLFKAVSLMAKAPNAPFSSSVQNAKLGGQMINFINGEYPTDTKERNATVSAITSAMQHKDTAPETQEQLGSAIVDALDKGVRSPGTMTVADRDILIDAYRNPRNKPVFDKDPKSLQVLERAVQHKMHKEIPDVLKSRYEPTDLKQVQATVSTNGALQFVPLKTDGGDFDRASAIASELNKHVAPKVNKTLDTWSAYSGAQGKITINPYAKLRNIMPVLGVEDVVIQQPQRAAAPQAAPAPEQPKVRRVVRKADGSGFMYGDQ